MTDPADNPLGSFLRDRRSRMDPAAFGFPAGRRRTPGLRREEVAQRANISPTWYTWLEQGRGGAPSQDVLNRLASGLMLTKPEREHLFILGLGRLPEPDHRGPDEITPRLQRVLDAFPASPAIIKSATWDVIAWNAAAAAVLTDYASLPPEGRNILRLMFTQSAVKAAQEDWVVVARYVVGAFRADAVRAGATAEIKRLVDELSAESREFVEMWSDNEVVSVPGGQKRIHHPTAGLIELEFSSFSIDGRPDLGLIVYNPASDDAAAKIARLMYRG